MSKIAEFRAAKFEADAVKEAKDGVEAKAVSVIVQAGAFSVGSETVNLHIKFAKANNLVVTPVLAKCLAIAVQQNIETLLYDAAQVATDLLVTAKTKARAEAEEVLQEVGP